MSLNTAAYGLYPQDVALRDVVHTLNSAGFENESICMMLSPTHPIASLVRDASVFNSECKSNAATAALIGWLSEFGAVMIPTVGFFIRSQAFFHALMVAHETPAFCGNSRTLSGLGFSDDDADRFENEIREMGVLVYVACPESQKMTWACELLRHTGAREASTLDSHKSTLAAMASA
ncbi:MAG TPA: hypothetical protein VGG14_18510 [Candidatus Sulfotelmatobacter sp.]|jgi:hypothetical protein